MDPKKRVVIQIPLAELWDADGTLPRSEPGCPFDPDRYPQGYAYIATEWLCADPTAAPIVLLERYH
jgi:hypothetical protein